MRKKQNLKQNGLYVLGKSSYSSDRSPAFQITMLNGAIADSKVFETDHAEDLPIPQVEIDLKFRATLKNTLNQNTSIGSSLSSNTFEDGTFVDISYSEPIIHLKEFNSFYEKENFEIEVYEVGTSGQLRPLKMVKQVSAIANGLLMDDNQYTEKLPVDTDSYEKGRDDSEYMEYFFDVEVDERISEELLCEAVKRLEINNQFLDEELICPDQRTDRFNIYATQVGPEDLEDCD